MNESGSDVKSPRQRLVSLDVLRGFDMFWIVGGDALLRGIVKAVAPNQPDHPILHHLEHVQWHGFSAYDLIFPLFIFIAGVAMPFSFAKYIQNGRPDKKLYWRIIRRAVLLVFLGLVYNGFFKFEFAKLRYPSVLGLIGLAYFWGAMIVMHFKPRMQFILAVTILLLYCLAMLYLPFPGSAPTDPGPDGNPAQVDRLSKETNLAGYLDQKLLPGRLYYGTCDPEGLLFMFPAAVLAIFGALAGRALKSTSLPDMRKVLYFIVAGVVLLGIGKLWDPWFPINKQLWSSSFICFAGGWCLLLLAVFYLIVDVGKIRKIFFPFVLIGMNPLTIYFCAHHIVDFDQMSRFFLRGAAAMAPDPLSPIILTLGVIAFELLFLWGLYRNKWFLRV